MSPQPDLVASARDEVKYRRTCYHAGVMVIDSPAAVVLPAVLPGRSLRTDGAFALLKQRRSEKTPCQPLLRRQRTLRWRPEVSPAETRNCLRGLSLPLMLSLGLSLPLDLTVWSNSRLRGPSRKGYGRWFALDRSAEELSSSFNSSCRHLQNARRSHVVSAIITFL